VLASLPARWLTHPSTLADCEYKPRQLAVAAGVGMRVPKTLITNDADAVREFAEQVGSLIVKPLAEPVVEEAGTYGIIWTRRVTSDDLANLGGVEQTAHLFQRDISPKLYEVRLTMIGEQSFAVAIYAESAKTEVDWRSDYDSLRYEAFACPPRIARLAREFMRRFGVRYGAFDFVVDELEGWWFLEMNAGGQWGWLAQECDLPIAAAIADELMRE
jgi:glutathione synthase/RimK-type ligase-like ATP-grasp enzyme